MLYNHAHCTWGPRPQKQASCARMNDNIVPDIDVKIHGVSVERVYATKFLGVIIDSKLTWKPHVEYICKKLYTCAGIIAKAMRKLNR